MTRPAFALFWWAPVFGEWTACSGRSWAATAEEAVANLKRTIPEASSIGVRPWDPARDEFPGGAFEQKESSAGDTPKKHPFGCGCNDCEWFRAEHGS